MKGVVSSGHPLTSRAASEMFSLGGNAFDAVLAAGFASVVTEPSLTSFGGGGFLLAHSEKDKKDTLFDFFVNTPGLGLNKPVTPEMNAVPIRFPGCTQIFHTGFGSVAVPGMLKGLLHVHKKLSTLPLNKILVPALSYLEEGVEINTQQKVFLKLLEPIMTASEYGKDIYIQKGSYAKIGDKLFNPDLKDFLRNLENSNSDIHSGEIAESLGAEMSRLNGMVTAKDLNDYEVCEREPLRIRYRDRNYR